MGPGSKSPIPQLDIISGASPPEGISLAVPENPING